MLKATRAAAERLAMEAYLSKACWRAGAKLTVGLAVLGAVVGIRIVTATPAGVEGEIAELERFDAEQAAAAASGVERSEAGAESIAARDGGATGVATPESDDLDRMVRCVLGGSLQFMRAADCATRGGALEELPPPEPEEAAPAPPR